MQNSVNADQEKQDQSQKTAMEDSTAMTIKFLRARLLSERSVSRAAQQRANELDKRVVELEERLKIVALQRKKAEKATAEVLAILENNGISDFSEAYDSGSDQEGVLSESKDGNSSTKDENSATSIPRGNEAEELSGSELEASLGRSLSWKRCNDGQLEKKQHIDQARRRSSFISIGGSSTKQHLGKSCRQIKRRETRSAVAEVRDEPQLLDAQQNGVGSVDISSCFKDRPEILKEGCKNEEEKMFLEGLAPGSLEDRREETNDGPYVNGSRRDVDMERALERQAQLIGQYQAEENAQREWEEKFRENNSCTPDSCEPGNRSDITEERDEIRAETVEPADGIPSHAQGAKLEIKEVYRSGEIMAKPLPNGVLPNAHFDMVCSQDQQCNSSMVTESQTGFPEFSFPGQEKPEAKANGNQKQMSENNSFHPPLFVSSEHQSVQKFPSFHLGGNSYKGESSGSQNQLQLATRHETPNGLGGVLEALQLAKLSLKQELNRLPLSTQGRHLVRATETPVQAIKGGDATEIPVGCAGLFRVPTGLQIEASTPQTNSLEHYTDSGSSLTRYYSDLGVGVAAGDRYSASPNLEMGSRVSTRGPYIDPYLDMGMGLPASSRYTYPSYAGLMPRMATSDGLPRPYPGMGPRMSEGDRYAVYDDQIRSNMHNR